MMKLQRFFFLCVCVNDGLGPGGWCAWIIRTSGVYPARCGHAGPTGPLTGSPAADLTFID